MFTSEGLKLKTLVLSSGFRGYVMRETLAAVDSGSIGRFKVDGEANMFDDLGKQGKARWPRTREGQARFISDY